MNFYNLNLYFYIFLLSFVPKVILTIFFPGIIDQSDPQGHLIVANNILSGCGISDSLPEDKECILSHGGQKGPGYPILLAFLLKISNGSILFARLFNSLFLSISILYFLNSLNLLIKSKTSFLIIGIILSLSPVTVPWSRHILTESISISLTLLIFSEILKMICLKKFNFLRISIFITFATFVRLDLILLFIPIIFALFITFKFTKILRNTIIIFIIFLTTWSLWFARNYYNDLNVFPQHQGINIFRTSDNQENYIFSKDGFFKWSNTWVYNMHQRSSVIHPQMNYKDIYVDFRNIGLDEDLKNRSKELLEELKEHDGNPFPKNIDDKFSKLAKKIISRNKLNYYFILPIKRMFYQWGNITNSNGWPLELKKMSYEERITLMNSSIKEKIRFAKNNLTLTLFKFFPNCWRILILITFLISTIYFREKILRNFILITLLFFIIKSIFSVYFVFIEVRYLVNILPIFETITCLFLINFINKKKLQK